MRRTIFGLLFTLSLAAPAFAQKFWKDLSFPPLREFNVPKPEVYTLPNGLQVFLLEDHALPKVEASVLIRTGYLWESAEKRGLAGVTGEVMRTGGTASRKGEALDELLEGLGASVETSIGRDEGSAHVFVLSEDLGTGLEVLADVLRNPAFPQEKLDLAKVGVQDSIARRNDDVSGIATREFRKLAYGKDSPYAAYPEYSTLAAIQREDLVAFHQRFFWPGNMILGLVGDFDSKEARALIEKDFGAWKNPAEAKRVEFPKIDYAWRNSLAVAVKADVEQAQIRAGHIGGRLDDPDIYALDVFTEIFGGGSFTCRLMQEVRTKRGLAYSINGGWYAEWERPGIFAIGGGTKNASVAEALKASADVLRDLTRKEPTAEELRIAKDSILNSFVFNFDTKAKIVGRLMDYAYHGYPMDYLENYKKGIEAVTSQDVLRVAQKHLKPEQLIYLVVGKASEFDDLKALGAGEPQMLDISIPGSP